MIISDRIRDICKTKKIKNIELVDAGLGSQQTVSYVLSGKQNPNSQFLEGFLNLFPDVNARWLITGEEGVGVNEPHEQYGFCRECIKKEGVIDHLKEQCAAKQKRIEELIRAAAELQAKHDQAQKKSKAS